MTIAIIVFGLVLGSDPVGRAVGALAWLILGFTLMGMTFGPMGALLPELFPANVRYTGSGDLLQRLVDPRRGGRALHRGGAVERRRRQPVLGRRLPVADGAHDADRPAARARRPSTSTSRREVSALVEPRHPLRCFGHMLRALEGCPSPDGRLLVRVSFEAQPRSRLRDDGAVVGSAAPRSACCCSSRRWSSGRRRPAPA